MIDAFGWTWEYIDEEMTLPRYQAICDHWARVPPLAVSAAGIAQYLGAIKSQQPAAKQPEERADNRQALLDMFGGTPGLSLSTTKKT